MVLHMWDEVPYIRSVGETPTAVSSLSVSVGTCFGKGFPFYLYSLISGHASCLYFV
jgi:hypothetical protein